MNANNETLIIFTNTYPYSVIEESFLDLEVEYLSMYFDKIVIIPQYKPSIFESIERHLPRNVDVNQELCNNKMEQWTHYPKIVLRAMSSSLFYKEIGLNLEQMLSFKGIKESGRYIGTAVYYKRWIKEYIKKENINLSKTVFYTYWIGSITLGIGLAKRNNPDIKLISRAHGIDLYFERHKTNYIPYRRFILNNINKLFLISNHGKNYIKSMYPEFESKYEVSRLGVSSSETESKSSTDDIFRIVSCSYLVSVKRVDLLIKGLKELGNLKPNQEFEWYHIGYGPLYTDLKKISECLLPTNIKYNFLGLLENKEVLSFYKNNPIDLFINVSSSEGVPVSIMEAQSFGIPVIATNVGGTSEIVSNSVGFLLSSKPEPIDIAKAISLFVESPSFTKKVKSESIKNWELNYNAKKNFTDFARTIREL